MRRGIVRGERMLSVLRMRRGIVRLPEIAPRNRSQKRINRMRSMRLRNIPWRKCCAERFPDACVAFFSRGCYACAGESFGRREDAERVTHASGNRSAQHFLQGMLRMRFLDFSPRMRLRSIPWRKMLRMLRMLRMRRGIARHNIFSRGCYASACYD